MREVNDEDHARHEGVSSGLICVGIEGGGPVLFEFQMHGFNDCAMTAKEVLERRNWSKS